MNLKPFKGSNVYMSRNLVPPEVFDSLHDALKLNGASVFLCSDPSCNSPHDFHVIASHLHEKFEDLRAKGCNLLGPQCVLSCAKEKKPLPQLGYVCCLAMDGVKVLTSGFDDEEKEKIRKLVIAMSGTFHMKASSEVSFVIVKNVMAGKYKWAVSKEKHVVTINWLNQCWVEHRVVPIESYRVPPFLGLMICVTRIPGDERKAMEKLIIQNGGKYSAELTKLCTHLICEAPEGDKYKVAQKWGNIFIVTRKWFDQSIARRVRVTEESFQIQSNSHFTSRNKPRVPSSQEKYTNKSQSILQSVTTDSTMQTVPSVGPIDSDLDVAQSQNFSSSCQNVFPSTKEEESGKPDLFGNDKEVEVCVADDSESDNDDLYLSDCRICLVGFKASDMRKLVGIVRKGGGSRYMSCSERLTHIVVGEPSDVEKRELRALSAHGVIHIVKRNWLEDCGRDKKEVPVIQKHIASDILLPKDLMGFSSKAPSSSVSSAKPGEISSLLHSATLAQNLETVSSVSEIEVEKNNDILDIKCNMSHSVQGTKSSPRSRKEPVVNDKDSSQRKIQRGDKLQGGKSMEVFLGKRFSFSPSFPADQRGEVVEWINEGSGEVVDDHILTNVDFMVERHGATKQITTSRTTYVSSHWIRSCLEDGCLLETNSHILYSPLPCRVPLPGFEGLRFCVSQYVEKERLLLRNLCFTLGAKFVEKLTRKVTHLLCKFANGPKYEASCKWGIRPVQCEWLYECVRKNNIVPLDSFHPEEVPENPESGVCTLTQYPTQAARLISIDNSSQFSSQSQDLRNINTLHSSKRSRLSDLNGGSKQDPLSTPCEIHSTARENDPGASDVGAVKNKSSRNFGQSEDLRKSNARHSSKRLKSLESKNGLTQDGQVRQNLTTVESNDDGMDNGGPGVPDVAAAIEDLLEQTSKIQDLKSPVPSDCEKSIFSADCSILVRDHSGSHSAFGPSRHWLNSLGKETQGASKDQSIGIHDGFSETQTESQLVGYEEDLSGRQMIIDRVRTRSSMT